MVVVVVVVVVFGEGVFVADAFAVLVAAVLPWAGATGGWTGGAGTGFLKF